MLFAQRLRGVKMFSVLETWLITNLMTNDVWDNIEKAVVTAAKVEELQSEKRNTM